MVNSTSDCGAFGGALNCSDAGSVVFLNLSNSEMKGSIPTTIGSMTALTYLDVAHSSLKSDLPTEIGALSGLTYLSLAENALTGTVPEQLAQLTALDSLFLHGNKFVGVVPHIRANLTTCKFVLASLPGNCFNISLTPDCTQLAGSCVCEEEGIKCHHDASTVGVTRTSASTLASTHATTNAIDISGGTDASAHDQKTKATKATKTEKPTKTKAADVSTSNLSAPVVLIAAMVVGVVVAVALIVLAVRLYILKRDRAQRKNYLQEIDDL